jgi:glucose/arabinose dehydrogenase
MQIIGLLLALLTGLPAATAGERHASARFDRGTTLDLVLVAEGLDRPVAVRSPPNNGSRLYVVEQPGVIRVIDDQGLRSVPFLDLRDRVSDARNEQGLLGLAFHPQFSANRRFIVNYTDLAGDTVIAEFSAIDSTTADPGSEAIILTVDQPFANHNGGDVAFGPDGFLWIAIGDGGGAGDPRGNAQNPQTLLGKLLRIDVDRGSTYVIPDDNPFAGDPSTRDEIWALGLRNPWRFSFDRSTGDLFIADVGQYEWEEVNFEDATSPGGKNYGWNTMEASQCFESSTCATAGLTLPVFEYSHAAGCSVTGGYVYRGRHASFSGTYVFGDFCSGVIWGLRRIGDGEWQTEELLRSGLAISGFGEGADGELYVTGLSRGEVYRLAVRSENPPPRRPGRRVAPTP